MKKEEVLLLIELAGEPEEKERQSRYDLELLLYFMYYSHLKMTDALRIAPCQLREWEGLVYSEKSRGAIVFEIPDVMYFRALVWPFLFNRETETPIIKTKKRALQGAFQELLLKARLPKYRLIDVYYAGYRDNGEIPKPHRIEIEYERD